MIDIKDNRPGDGFRSKVFQQNDPFLKLVESDRQIANHEQGTKVQFVFTPNAPTYANFNSVVYYAIINQSWPLLGTTYFGIDNKVSVSVVIPVDTVVNDVTVRLFVAPTEYKDDLTPLDQWRFAKGIKVYNATNINTMLFFNATSGFEDAIQIFTGSSTNITDPLPNDVTNSVFGSSTVNVGATNPQNITAYPYSPAIPAIQKITSTAAGGAYLATIITSGSENTFVFTTDGTIGYFSLCWVEIIVNGYTRNR